ncbi:hypothetical protein ZIOFF_028246 [Zingiber officinale]|uniref:Morc S5 domain-containing protein n=1 Tax=Zingiber officinale TaxID=94328 RepID=A0A8J5LDN8_ZINOF|nr:hypothetical protein ZIOFF_028246 [Zingiber officinale]
MFPCPSNDSQGLGLEFHVAKCFGAPLQVVDKVHFPYDDLLLADYYRGVEVQRLLSTSLLHSKWSDFPLFISGGYILLVYAHLMSVATAVLRMNYTNFIDLSCDEESEQTYFEDVKPIFPLQISSGKSGCSTVNDQSLHRGVSLKQELEESRSSTSGSSITDQGGPSANMISLNFASPSSPVPLCRQFWKSGDYEVGQAISSTSEKYRVPLRAFTQSIGLLSYTFLRETGCDDIIVPTDSSPFSTKNASLIGVHNFMQADYEFDELTNSFKRLYRHDEKHFSSNLSTILEWSPFDTEDKLLAQFIDIGHHGTKIMIFNLWLNDDGNMELDFQLDAKGSGRGRRCSRMWISDVRMVGTIGPWLTIDWLSMKDPTFLPWVDATGIAAWREQRDIMISEAQRQVQKNKHDSKQIANRLRFSLRAYISILYLRIPQNFRIVLRGEVVRPHNIANDLIYRECILYKPQACGVSEASIVTTIGFLDGAPNVNVHGFNVYHKNRLILCSLHLHMLPQLHMKYCVAFKPPLKVYPQLNFRFPIKLSGVLETNFIKPTHDKQDFEKSALYQKLESRLKEMTYEYWDLHCHLVGYYNNKKPAAPRPSSVVCQMPQLGTSGSLDLVETKDFTPANLERTTLITASTQPISCTTPTDLKCDGSIQTRLPLKRKNENQVAVTRETKVQNLSNPFGSRRTKPTKDSGSGVQPIPDIKAMILKNKELRDQCLEYEETEKQLMQKAKKLRTELLEVLEAYKKLLIDVIPIEDVKTETL